MNLLQEPTRQMSIQNAIGIVSSHEFEKLPTEVVNALRTLISVNRKKVVAAKKLDDPFKLASMFIAKNEVRYYLNHIYSNGKRLVGSNGHILIVIEHAIEQGYYNALGERVDFDVRYPDVSRVLNNALTDKFELSVRGEQFEKLGKKRVEYWQVGSSWYLAEYVKLLQKVGVKEVQQTTEKKHAALHFEKDNFKGIVMPYRMGS